MTSDKLIAVKDLWFEPFLSAEQIAEQVREMGKNIATEYAGKNPLFISVLNGAFIFAADLVRAANIDCETAFTRLSSYDGLQSTGQVKTSLQLDVDLAGRHLIIVEDIVDTGKTLHQFSQMLQTHQPASIAVAALLIKPEAIAYTFDIAYRGFEIPNKFVVGYGLDYNGSGRQLSSIYQLHTTK